MNATAHGRWGILVVRAWIDDAAGTGLRARIITTGNPPNSHSEISAAVGVDETVDSVRRWLQNLEAHIDSLPRGS